MFQLDPKSIAVRARYAQTPRIPSLAQSLARGAIGFTLVSVAGFAPWALGGGWIAARVGEAGLYACCALVFLGLSGLLLHRLIIGPETLRRFYQVFGLAFIPYAVAWTLGFMLLHGDKGGLIGLLAGTLLFGTIVSHAFLALRHAPVVGLVLFATNAAGYFGGGYVEQWFGHLAELGAARMTVAMLMWGVCYGLGFGVGLGYAFYACQAEARRGLSAPVGMRQ